MNEEMTDATPAVDAYDAMEAEASEMSPQAREDFMAHGSGAEELQDRLQDPAHSPVVGPRATKAQASRRVLGFPNR